MKRNMLLTMNNLEIDAGIQNLIRQLWKHEYKTFNSCEGRSDDPNAYIMFSGGDGWFEKKAAEFGLEKQTNNPCCKTYEQGKCCFECGAGILGNSIYRGILIQDQIKHI